ERVAARRGGDRERRIGRGAGERGGDVVADHVPLGRVGQPGERHRAGELRGRAPARPAVGGGRGPHVELAGRGGAASDRIVVVGQREVRRAAGGGLVHRQAGDEVVDPAADRIERDARQLGPLDTVGGR